MRTPPPATHAAGSGRQLSDQHLAYVLLRLTFGVNFLGHGGVRIIGGVGHFADATVQGFQGTVLPLALVRPFALLIPGLEALLGVLVIVGLALRLTLTTGALLMTALTLGLTQQSNWNGAGWALTYALVFSILLFGRPYNAWSLDTWRRKGAAS